MVIHETGQLDAIEIVTARGTPIEPGSIPLSMNPLGKIPVLQPAQGAAIYDSRVICQYLDDKVGGGLYRVGDNRWLAMTQEATADGILDSAISIVYENRMRPVPIRYSAWVDAQWQKIERSVAVLNDRCAELTGALSIGQIAVFCALGYLDFRHSDRTWRARAADLSEWYDQFSTRDSAFATSPSD